MTAGETLNVSFVLEPLALETVTVTADANSFYGMGGFQERKARGTGRYFTHDDIKLMQARQVTDVLRRVPGMQIQFGSAAFGGGTQTARAGRSVGGTNARPCVMNYYVNGTPFPLPSDASINQYVSSDDLAAVEVYTGSSQIPAEFNSAMYGSRCGVVAIWTRGSLDARASH
jgi:TonB-dependent receptor-like protein